MQLALIDADILVYRIGYACKDEDEYTVEKTLQSNIGSIMRDSGAYDYDLYLTGAENFRKEVATIKPYKGNRKADKPKHYEYIRERLMHMGAIVSHGEEADDLLGKHQTDETIICTIDKDLDMIPGWHYNFVKGKKYLTTEAEALMFFWHQMMTGDSTDNITGVPGMGPKKADQVFIDNNAVIEEVIDDVLDMYHAHYVDTWRAVAQENADLLWIRRANWLRYDLFNGVS